MTTLGEFIDGQGISLDLEPGEIITDIVVVAEVMTERREKYLALAKDENTNWLKEFGMLTMAVNRVSNE